MAFSYKSRFEDALEAVRREGRYRVFADLKRIRGRFPQALWTGPEGQEREVWSGWRERLDRKRLTPGIEFAQAIMPAASRSVKRDSSCIGHREPWISARNSVRVA